jgi:hypothetical protein
MCASIFGLVELKKEGVSVLTIGCESNADDRQCVFVIHTKA